MNVVNQKKEDLLQSIDTFRSQIANMTDEEFEEYKKKQESFEEGMCDAVDNGFFEDVEGILTEKDETIFVLTTISALPEDEED